MKIALRNARFWELHWHRGTRQPRRLLLFSIIIVISPVGAAQWECHGTDQFAHRQCHAPAAILPATASSLVSSPSLPAITHPALFTAATETAARMIPPVAAPVLNESPATQSIIPQPAAQSSLLPTPPSIAESPTESLWVLPPEVIPPTAGAGALNPEMTRERGYLDAPNTIALAGEQLNDFTVAQLHRGLEWEYCGPRPATLGPAPPIESPSTTAPVEMTANSFNYQRHTDTAELHGQVQMQRANQSLTADSAQWYRQTNDVAAAGNVSFDAPGVRVISQAARFNLTQRQGDMHQAHYRFTGAANLRGYADHIHMHSPQLIELDQLTYTACRPGDNSWALRAQRLTIDRRSGRGIAHHAHIRIKNMPVLYTPYFSFPLDDRRYSGVLIPSIGSTESTGMDLSIPYYFNLAPNWDATLTPRIMTARGLLLGAEMRYLTARDSGGVNVELIPQDRRYEDGATWRGAVHLRQNGQFNTRWRTQLDYSLVSDDQYWEDFGNSLEITSTRRLLQRGDVYYTAPNWSLLLRAEAFQSIDAALPATERPYGRLPHIQLTTRPLALAAGMQTEVTAEYDLFDHDHLVRGHRLAVQPQLSWPVHRSYGYFIPSARVALARYELDHVSTAYDAAPSYAIPSVDVDGKLLFERPLTWHQQPLLQTIEPRLYYLYTPYEAQDDIPIFDSSELNFSFNNLFRANRFTGRDRIGDANQLTLGVTTRTIQPQTGIEWLRASIGQMYYFADQRVQIDGYSITGGSSPFAGELAAQLSRHWSGQASFQWDTESDTSAWQKRHIALRYAHPNRQVFNIAYRFDAGNNSRNRYEDTDVSLRWPLQRFELVGRWLYSLQHEQTMEAIAGIEYGHCCWRVRVVGRHFKNSADSSGSNALMMQVELAGLGKIGSSINRLLARELDDE